MADSAWHQRRCDMPSVRNTGGWHRRANKTLEVFDCRGADKTRVVVAELGVSRPVDAIKTGERRCPPGANGNDAGGRRDPPEKANRCSERGERREMPRYEMIVANCISSAARRERQL